MLRLSRIEDLRDAVFGAGLDAVQMTSEPVTGGLAFAERQGIVYTSGLLDGTVSLSGPLSEDCVTLGLGLRIAPGSWHWHEPVGDGSVGVFRPGDEHDSLYRSGSLYAAVTLSQERLETEAAALDPVLDDNALGGTRFARKRSMQRRLRDFGIGLMASIPVRSSALTPAPICCASWSRNARESRVCRLAGSRGRGTPALLPLRGNTSQATSTNRSGSRTSLQPPTPRNEHSTAPSWNICASLLISMSGVFDCTASGKTLRQRLRRPARLP